MALSGSLIGVHMIPQLSVEGKRVNTRRPHTTCGNRREEQDDGSEAATYVVEDKTERQTRVKLESLERRLRANEKARKEVEEELEQWKARALKAESALPDLNSKYLEMTKKYEESRENSLEIEAKYRVHEEERAKSQEEADESGKRLEEVCCHMASLLVEDQEELELMKHSPSDVLGKVKHIVERLKRVEQENGLLMEQLKKSEERLEKTRSQLERMGNEVQQLKRLDVDRHGEQLEELHASLEVTDELKQSIYRMETSATQQSLENDMLRAELRCAKSKNHELEQSLKNSTVLLRSAESEKKAFLETLAALLGKEDLDEQGIKRCIREVVSLLERIKTEKVEQEKEAKSKEEGLLNQAKLLRSALFRARTAEDEVSVIMEKLQTTEQEVLAIELELKASQERVAELEGVIQQLGELLDVQGETQLAALVKRVAELVKLEMTYAQIFGDKHGTGLLPDLRQIEMFRRRLKAVDTLGSKKAGDILDKQLLTQMTLDTLKAADTQKTVLKYKLSEQERKIRNLEREKREAEKLKDIVSKWSKKEKGQVSKSRSGLTSSEHQSKSRDRSPKNPSPKEPNSRS